MTSIMMGLIGKRVVVRDVVGAIIIASPAFI